MTEERAAPPRRSWHERRYAELMPPADLDKLSAYVTHAFEGRDPRVFRATLDLGAPDRVPDQQASIRGAVEHACVAIIVAPNTTAVTLQRVGDDKSQIFCI